MAAEANADQAWADLSTVSEEERQAQMQQRYATLLTLPEPERLTQLRAMVQAEYSLPDADLRPFTASRLRTLLRMEPTDVTQLMAATETVMQQLPGTIAMRRVALVQTLAREFSMDEQARLQQLIPGVFGAEAMGSAPAAPPPTPQPVTTARPWWAFWKKA